MYNKATFILAWYSQKVGRKNRTLVHKSLCRSHTISCFFSSLRSATGAPQRTSPSFTNCQYSHSTAISPIVGTRLSMMNWINCAPVICLPSYRHLAVESFACFQDATYKHHQPQGLSLWGKNLLQPLESVRGGSGLFVVGQERGDFSQRQIICLIETTKVLCDIKSILPNFSF